MLRAYENNIRVKDLAVTEILENRGRGFASDKESWAASCRCSACGSEWWSGWQAAWRDMTAALEALPEEQRTSCAAAIRAQIGQWEAAG